MIIHTRKVVVTADRDEAIYLGALSLAHKGLDAEKCGKKELAKRWLAAAQTLAAMCRRPATLYVSESGLVGSDPIPGARKL